MKVIVVEPGRKPYVKEIESGLESLQAEVGGYIEGVYPFDDMIAIICDEEGKLKGKPLNRALRNEDGYILDALAGTFLIVGVGLEDFDSIPDELEQKYLDMFMKPDTFMKMPDGNILVI